MPINAEADEKVSWLKPSQDSIDQVRCASCPLFGALRLHGLRLTHVERTPKIAAQIEICFRILVYGHRLAIGQMYREGYLRQRRQADLPDGRRAADGSRRDFW